MKFNLILISTLFISSWAFAQEEEKLFLNWGLVNYNDDFLVDQTEIKMGEWLDFVYYNNPKEYPSYLKMKKLNDAEKEKLLKAKMNNTLLPDTNVLNQWNGRYIFKECERKKLLRFSSVGDKVYLPVNADSLEKRESRKRLLDYLNTPVTGISYEQALAFCRWRTAADSLKFYTPPVGKRIVGNIYIRPISSESYIFSLPTPTQFDLINPNQDSILTDNDRLAGFNYKNSQYSENKKRNENKICGHNAMACGCFFGSGIGVFDVQGNAGEMTSQKGVARGGSFYHDAKSSYKGQNNYYSKPEIWLGFRCVAHRRR